jgi:hypothetical protein
MNDGSMEGKFSMFQRHHALHRVFLNLTSTAHRSRSDASGQLCAPLKTNAAA